MAEHRERHLLLIEDNPERSFFGLRQRELPLLGRPGRKKRELRPLLSCGQARAKLDALAQSGDFVNPATFDTATGGVILTAWKERTTLTGEETLFPARVRDRAGTRP